jgi:hypothetical protein
MNALHNIFSPFFRREPESIAFALSSGPVKQATVIRPRWDLTRAAGRYVVVCYAKIPSDPYLIELLSLISSVSLRMGTAKSSTKLAENFSQQTARCAILATHVTILY